MARNRLWVLNFDADEELATGAGHQPSRAVVARFAALETRVGALLAPGDRVFHDDTAERFDPDAFEGRAWSPTARARRAWNRAGVSVPRVPTIETLRRVTSRRFAAELGQTLPGAAFVDDAEHFARILAGASPTGEWLVKRAFGFAGRARKLARAGDVSETLCAWVAPSFATGDGVQVEPYVTRESDFGLHGFVDERGGVTLGEVTTQRVDANGAWVSTERASRDALRDDERSALIDAATRSANALAKAGYFGPFGVDAFRWIDADGSRRFNPRCEVNARYSMGWAVGMGERRPDLEPYRTSRIP
jgi:hypothetical protein